MEEQQTPWISGLAQGLYARILRAGTLVGLTVLVVTFVLYVFGVIEPAVPPGQLPQYWSLSSRDYLEAINRDFLHLETPPRGWVWLTLLSKGDFLNFIGIAVLSVLTIVCFLAITPTLYRQRRFVSLLIALLQAFVLMLAASGVLDAGR